MCLTNNSEKPGCLHLRDEKTEIKPLAVSLMIPERMPGLAETRHGRNCGTQGSALCVMGVELLESEASPSGICESGTGEGWVLAQRMGFSLQMMVLRILLTLRILSRCFDIWGKVFGPNSIHHEIADRLIQEYLQEV